MTEAQTQQIAFVSGASRGIGRAVAEQLAEDGFDIAFCYRDNVAAARETETAIRDRSDRRVYALRCDVSDYSAVKAMLDDIEDNFGSVSVLINNAGINIDVPLPMMKPQDWKSVIDINLDSVFNVCRAASLMLIRQGHGCIVNISSVSGIYGNPGQTNYSAAKAGIIGFSKALSKELGRYGVRVNVVAPGLIDTDMVADMPEKMRKEILKSVLLKRVGTAQDVANLVSFLCSAKADYITGQVLQVDGGLVV